MSRPEILIPQEFSRLLDDDWREAAVYGGRYSLKSHTVARVLLIRAIQKKTRIFCGREFQNSIADSSYQLLVDLILKYELTMFHVTRDSIINTRNESDFLFKGIKNNTQSVKSIEGIDIAWIEEAQTITEPSLEILTPTVRKKGSQIIYTYNRLAELDPIHKRLVIDGRPNTLVINANYDTALKYNWLNDEQKNEIEFDKQNNPELYAHKWLGEPMSQAEMSIIGRANVLGAMERKIEDDGAIIVGVDVARMGNDRTVFWKRKGLKTIGRQIFTKLRTTQVCDALEQFVGFDKTIELKIDDTGVGGGVTDEMIKRGYNVVAINFGGSAQDNDKYPNWISEAWFHMAKVLPDAEIPYDSDLLMELSTRQWKQDDKGKRRVESKIDYKKRGFRSPDIADACIICYGEQATPNMLEFYRQQVSSLDTKPVIQS
jgi:phage terminase large subunit